MKLLTRCLKSKKKIFRNTQLAGLRRIKKIRKVFLTCHGRYTLYAESKEVVKVHNRAKPYEFTFEMDSNCHWSLPTVH